jgi:hypothetical protein
MTAACIDDKRSQDRASARFISLPESASRQLQYAQEHCRRIATALRLPTEQDVPSLFMLDERFRPVTVTTPDLQAHINRHMPFPLQAIRRTIRSYLDETEVTKTVKDCLLGHWSYGEEPFGNTSGCDYGVLSRQMRDCMERFLTFLGFRPLPSWLST